MELELEDLLAAIATAWERGPEPPRVQLRQKDYDEAKRLAAGGDMRAAWDYLWSHALP